MDVGQDNTGGTSPSGALAASDNLRAGQKLGRYTLLTPVAQGGMARVWAARQVGIRGFQKLVAIKTIMPALAADPEFERMFQDEARIAAAIHHPNVAEILDLGEVGSVLFLAMEWVDGVSLLSLLKARPRVPLPDHIAARIIADACAGLHAAHELRGEHGESLQVVHRDVSPHNILVGHDGTVKVADFGVAKAMGLEHAPTVAGQLKGKVAYMSPEQAMGDTNVDRRSDIFSLGAVLYECVTGQRAWAGANDVARLQNLLAGNIIAPRQVRTDLPADLENVLAYALAVDPARRFQSAEQLRVALEQFLVSRKLIVSPADVAGYVQALCGRELEERRVRIRHASTLLGDDGAAGMAGSAQSLSGVAVHARSRGLRRSTATAITFVAGGITIAGLLGIVAIGSLPPAAPQTPATTSPSATPPAPTAPGTVTVNPTPVDAIVEVNGVVIGQGRRSFARPGPGETHKVVVRAQGYEPATITIDHNSTETEWAVTLAKLAPAASSAPAASAAPPNTEAPPATAAATPPRPTPLPATPAANTGKGGRPTKLPSIPENPF